MRGRKAYIGTDDEKQQVQIRIRKTEVQEVKDNDFYGFGDMSKYILSLWKADRERREAERV